MLDNCRSYRGNIALRTSSVGSVWVPHLSVLPWEYYTLHVESLCKAESKIIYRGFNLGATRVCFTAGLPQVDPLAFRVAHPFVTCERID